MKGGCFPYFRLVLNGCVFIFQKKARTAQAMPPPGCLRAGDEGGHMPNRDNRVSGFGHFKITQLRSQLRATEPVHIKPGTIRFFALDGDPDVLIAAAAPVT